MLFLDFGVADARGEGIFWFVADVAPTSSTDPNVYACGVGSWYLNYTTPAFYMKTAAPNTWTQIS